MHVKLSEWAKRNGVHYQTAWTWWKQGRLPAAAFQTESGTILVEVPGDSDVGLRDGAVAIYGRVSSSDQKDDLDRQLGRLAAFASGEGMRVVKAVGEVGSGLNGRRRKLLALLSDGEVSTIVVERRSG